MPDPVSPEFLRRYAEVIVHIGLNVRPGQRLLVGEPFELQGVAPAARPLVDAVAEAARAAGVAAVDVLWGDEERVRAAAGRRFDPEFEERLTANAARMQAAVARRDALLFLQTGHPHLTDGIEPRRVAAFRRRCWAHYGPVAQALVAGRTNWTAAPAPTAAWAQAVFPGKVREEALVSLWAAVLAACRVDGDGALAGWRSHLDRLQEQRIELNARRAARVRYRGAGTDLVVALARDHLWCTAHLCTPEGIAFVANLPTEEVFTAPDCAGAEGTLRVARPLAYGGSVIEGVELEFRAGRVARASAGAGGELLQRLLATDEGAARLGEVAVLPAGARPRDALAPPLFFHPLLDENALPHVALGEGYGFCVGRAGARQLNRSLVHVDLPVDAEVTLLA